MTERESVMELQYLATMDNAIQVHMLCDLLRNEGIEPFTKNEILNAVHICFPIEVHVLQSDYERALHCLREAFPYLGY